MTPEAVIAELKQATLRNHNSPAVVDISTNTSVIVGDLHADIGATMTSLDGLRSCVPTLILGDILDRGLCSMQSLLLVLLLQKDFTNLVLLQGNHEEPRTYLRYTVPKEVHFWFPRHAKEILDALARCMESLPHMAVLSKRFVFVHGGISLGRTLEDLRAEPKDSRVWKEVHWNDPTPQKENIKHVCLRSRKRFRRAKRRLEG